MTVHEYHIAAMRTATPKCKLLSNVGLGIAGEAGEVADLIKKTLHQGHMLDKKQLALELGDVVWYIALGCEVLGYDFEYILRMNIEKLKKRYPDGFDAYHSVHREEEKSQLITADGFAR